MKITILQSCFFFILFSCSDSFDDSFVKKQEKSVSELSEVNSKKNSSSRSPEGSGTGSSGTIGYSLTWNGDGRWYGNFGGSPVWFWGPTPTQLQNGIQGTWPVTCAYYTQGVCYPDGFTVTGDGSGFTVAAPACANFSSTTISMPRITAVVNFQYNGVPIYTNIAWGTETRTIKSFSGGTCTVFAQGKVIVNQNCKPIIVSPTSTFPINLCGYLID